MFDTGLIGNERARKQAEVLRKMADKIQELEERIAKLEKGKGAKAPAPTVIKDETDGQTETGEGEEARA